MVEKIAVPVSNLVKLRDDFDITYSALIEPATVAYRAVGEIKNSNVVIIGTGAIGMMMQGICRFNNNKVISMDVSDKTLATAKELGADLAVNIKDNNKINIINEYFHPQKADVVVIAYLTKENYEFAVEIVQKAGTIIYMSMPLKFEIDFAAILYKAVKIVPTISYNFDMFRIAANYIQNDILGNRKLVTKTFPMDKAQQAYEYKINNPGTLKVVVTRK
jgi:threonine dehydrogenase-like Zn-dependent dehydrogenase